MCAMAGLTLAQAEAKLQEYLDAETRVLNSQEYSIAGRSNKMAMLEDIQTGIDRWDLRVKTLTQAASGRGRSISVAPGL